MKLLLGKRLTESVMYIVLKVLSFTKVFIQVIFVICLDEYVWVVFCILCAVFTPAYALFDNNKDG